MPSEPLNSNRIRLALIATDLSPADYPLGSLESRVAALALLDRVERTRPQMSEYGQDCLTIFQFGQLFLRGTPWKDKNPIFAEAEKSVVYQNGKKLADPSPAQEALVTAAENEARMEDLMESLLESSGNEFPPPDAEGREPFLRYTLYAMLLEGLLLTKRTFRFARFWGETVVLADRYMHGVAAEGLKRKL